MAEEYLDILDEQGKPTGKSRTYFDAHKEGLMHRAVHVWVVNSQKQILLQKRSADRRAYPNCWDISASGHISAGQKSIEAAQMETKEELGLELPVNFFIYLFNLEEHIVLNEGTYINNEFQDIYIVRIDIDVSSMHSDQEVSDLRWVDINEFKKWTDGKGEKLVPHKEEYEHLLEYLKQNENNQTS